MKLGLINSAWLGTHVTTAEGIRKTKEIGFDTIDIFADPLEIDIRERKLISERFVVGAGCEVPRDTPPENVRALSEYAHGHRP